MDWLDLLAVQGTLKGLLQHHSSKASILWHSAFVIVQLSHPYMTIGKTIALTRRTFVSKNTQKNYTKTDLQDPDHHDGVISSLEPHILSDTLWKRYRSVFSHAPTVGFVLASPLPGAHLQGEKQAVQRMRLQM